MPKTLADLTPAERAECVGMWVFDQELGLLIYAGVDRSNAHMFMQPVEPDYRWDERLLQAIPRFDLPRAWQADGTPPQGRWQPGGIAAGLDRIHPMKYGDDTHRRFITEWEPQP